MHRRIVGQHYRQLRVAGIIGRDGPSGAGEKLGIAIDLLHVLVRRNDPAISALIPVDRLRGPQRSKGLEWDSYAELLFARVNRDLVR